MENKILVGTKGKERWYPKFAPHIILGTNISVLDLIRDKKIYLLNYKKNEDKKNRD